MQRLYSIAALALMLFMAAGCPPAQAQSIYKCVKDGKTSFQGEPCETGSASRQIASQSGAAGAESALVNVYTQALALGVQLGIKNAERKGAKMSSAQKACYQAIKPGDFHGVVQKAIASAFTPEEIAALNRFFNSPAGQKYAKRELLEVYAATGNQAPEPPPALTDSERGEIESFIATPTGRAFMARSDGISQVSEARVNELVTRCKGQ